MFPRPSRTRAAVAALALLTTGLALSGPAPAQQPIPTPMPPAAPSAELLRLTAAAKAQAAPAAPGQALTTTEQKRFALAAALQPAMPGQSTPALPAATQLQAFGAVTDRLQTQYGLRPGTPTYSNALQDQLIQLRVRQFGPPLTGVRPVPAAPQAPDRSSVTTTAVYQRNFPAWAQRAALEPRIVGGNATADADFLDCVLLDGDCQGFGCSGTLIGKNVVLTAAHCITGGCPHRVFIGSDKRSPSRGKTINVKYRIPHPGFDPTTLRNDIAVVILDADADVTLPGLTSAGGPARVAPRGLATTAEINGAKTVELVGFGRSQFAAFGVKSQVLVTISSYECSARGDADKFDCHSGTELVAGGNGLDSCNGDSGGPAYVQTGAGLKLAAVTSRKSGDSTRPCGDGGVYTRVDAYAAWVSKTAADYGGRFR